ncbi:MAG: resE3 [Clostridia bacterium]|nr:resE3 [Clostridia bacterium]
MNFLKKYKSHNWRIWSTAFIAIIFLLLLDILFSYIFTTCSMDHPSLAESNWQYKIESGYEGALDNAAWSISDNTWLKLNGPINNTPKEIKKIIYYRTILPDTRVDDPHLLLQTNDHAFEVYLEEKRIYSFGNFDSFDYKHSPGAPTHLIDLPEEYQGKELMIAMKSVSEKRLGLIRTIELDSKGNHFMRIFKMNISTLILACISIIIGIVSMFIGTVRRLGRKALFSLGSSFLVVGAWSISENALTQLFNFRPIFWFYVAMISFCVIPISIYKFIVDISSRHKKILVIFIHLHIILLAVALVLNITGILAFINIINVFYILTSISFVACIVVSIRSYIEGNSKALIYTVGLVVFGVFGLYDVLGWYFGIMPWTVNMAPWGMFIFQLALIYALIIYLKETQDRLTQYDEKLEEKEKQIDQAMEYDKIKTEFFANVSHEMRTPLNIIYSTNQLMKVYHDKGIIGGKESNIDKYINIMNQNCYRLMKLVNNTIDITKIEAGFYKLNLKKVNIVSLVEDITMSIEEYAMIKDIKLVFDTELEEKIIICDPVAIERTMLNLLSNAIKFTKKEGSVYVNLTIGESNVCIEVEDTGIGIPKDKIDNVFDRFVQVDKSFTRQNEGSGMGLALVKALIEMHNGKIELISDLNKGSKFRVILPVKVEESIIVEEVEINEGSSDKTESVAIEFSDIYN